MTELVSDENVAKVYETIGVALDGLPLSVVFRILTTFMRVMLESYPEEGREELTAMLYSFISGDFDETEQ
jgi:hypothetical protein